MAEIYDKIDLTWSNRGDFIIGHSGDLGDTSRDILRSLYQEALTRIKSNLKDWKKYPNIGASLSDFVGEPNNKTTAESIKTRIITSLTKNGFIKNNDIEVKYIPLDIDRLAFRISISVAPTAINRGSDLLTITMLYNYSENNISVIR